MFKLSVRSSALSVLSGLLVASSFTLFAQQTTQPKQAQPAAQGAQPGIATIRNRTKLVVIDVVVTGKDRTPYKGLKASDFSVTENGVPQTLKSFEEHTGLSDGEALKFPPVPTLPPGIYSNFTPTPINSAVNILLLDALNTPLKDQEFVRSQLLDYVKKAKPGTSVAIFSLTTQLHMLQGFTTDPERLRQSVKDSKGNFSPLLDNPLSGAAQDSLITSAGVSAGQAAAGGSSNVLAMQSSLQLQIRAKYTLDAMAGLARYLANIPGRKNLIWFSGSFPVDILPDPNALDPFIAMADSEAEYRETINQLALSQVAVYPIDARGLMTQPMFDAENSGHSYARSPGNFTKDSTAFFNSTADEHGTMRRMAEDTGGEAFVNTNGLSQAVSKAIAEGSNYYTIAYSPTDTKSDSGYRTIKVKLSKDGYQLAYRHGYYADDPDGKKSALASAADKTTAPPAPAPGDANMLHAMVHGLPGSTQIMYKVRVLPASTQTDDKLAPHNRLPAPDPTPRSVQPAPAPPPYQRYALDYAIDPHDITFTGGPDGLYHCSLEFVSLVYQPDGRLAVELTDVVSPAFTRDDVKLLLHSGLPFHQEVSVPVKGVFTIRTGVHDLKADKIGAVELPVSAVARLAPLPPPPANPTPPPSR